MTEELIGYTLDQHRELSQVVLAARKFSSPSVAVASQPDVYPGVCRVILHESDPPVYRPKELRECALFELNLSGQQKTIEFSGHELEGDLILKINDIEIQISCDADTEELREKLDENGIKLNDCRATVFPGFWEFDFNGGKFFEKPPTLTCEAFEPDPDDDDAPVFSGDITIVDEAWVSVTTDGENVKTVETRDWIPHKSGQLTAGAIGGGVWSHEAGWLVLAWQCRDYSFAASEESV
jgi:hypothetical protein